MEPVLKRPSDSTVRVPDYKSPEVSAEGRVTLRYYHESAREVWCEAEWNAWEPTRLERTESGMWSYTSEPLARDIYEYNLYADGARVIDYQNAETKNRFTFYAHVPGAEPAAYDQRDVPHGTVHVHWYESKVTGTTRRMHVYTPPGYELETGREYPVLYLLHGAGDDDEAWVRAGRANWILDNLIASGRAEPMVVVMPNGHVFGQNWKEDRGTKLRGFAAEFYEYVMPGVTRMYRVRKERRDTALAGLSMGGGQVLSMGVTRPEVFGAYGIFSSGLWPEVTPLLEGALPALRANAPEVLWVGIGRRDFLYGHCTMLRRMLTVAGVPFTYHEDDTAHSWRAWRDYLERFAPLLFRTP